MKHTLLVRTLLITCWVTSLQGIIDPTSPQNSDNIRDGKEAAHRFAQQLQEASLKDPQSPDYLKHEIHTLHKDHRLLEKELSIFKKNYKNSLDAQKHPLFSFSTDFKTDLWYGANLELLNDSNPADNYSFVQTVFDARFATRRSQWHENIQPLELTFVARCKGIMGNVGHYTQTTETPMKIGMSFVETPHGHSVNRLLLWARELSLKYYYNDILDSGFFQVGFFPFHIGNGFSLGNSHIVGQAIPGQFNADAVDQYRPGALFSAGLFNNILTLQGYIGFIETLSQTFNVTASLANTQSLEVSARPERGPFKKNVVAAIQGIFDIARYRADKVAISCTPYLVLQNDNTHAIEFDNDSAHRLITPGIIFKYEKQNLSCSFEAARNFGSQKVKHWDRNQIVHMGGSYIHDHMLYIPAGTAGVDFTVNNAAAAGVTDPDDYEFSTININPDDIGWDYGNGVNFSVARGIPAPAAEEYDYFKNSYSRFRRAYKNSYEGWMVYADLCYNITPTCKVATAVGCASGDDAPNDTEEKILLTRVTPGITYKDLNKNYKGFIGVQELFEGKTIRSHFLFEAQKLIQTHAPSDSLTKPTFSNLIFWGFNSSYHKEFNHKTIDAQCNVIGFMNYHSVQKNYSYPLTDYWGFTHNSYTTAHATNAEKRLGKYLGTECNARIDVQIARDVLLFGTCAIFIPGQYYTDAESKYIPIATQIKLANVDASGIEDDANKYNMKLGKDTAFLMSAGISAHFDSISWTKSSRRKHRQFTFLKELFARKNNR